MMLRYGAVIAALSCVSPALAQNASDNGDDIIIACLRIDPPTQIVVNGGLLPRPMDQSITPLETIIAPDRNAGARIENQLRDLPGLAQFRRSDARSANPTSQGITLRGLGGNAASRTLILLDGVPQADPFGGWVSWPAYDGLKLGGITLRRGGGSGADGSGALSGTIDLYSDLTAGGSASAAYGSRNSVDLDGSAGFDLGAGGRLHVSAGYSRGDGFAPIIASQRGAADGAAPYRQLSGQLRMVAPLADDTRLQATIRAFDDKRTRGLPFSANRNGGVDASIRIVHTPGRDDWQWLALGYVQIRGFSSQFPAVAADRNSVAPTLDQYDVPATGLGAKVEVRPPLGPQWQLRLGSEWRRTMGETREDFTFVAGFPTRNRTAGGKTDQIGAFAELTRDASWGTVSLGGRLDRWSLTRGFRREVNIGGSIRSDDRFADRDDWEGTARLAARLPLSQDIAIDGALYSGWRLPTLNELYRPFRVGADAVAANEALKPEQMRGGELGLSWRNRGFSAELRGFAARLDDVIANVTLGQGPGVFPGVGFVAAGGRYSQRLNLARLSTKGIEARASFDEGPWRASVAYSYSDPVVRDGRPALSGLRPAQTARHAASASLNYNTDRLMLGAAARYIGAQFDDDRNLLRLADALTFDATAQLAIGDRFQLIVRGENLGDARVEAARSASGIIERAQPRTLWLGVSLRID